MIWRTLDKITRSNLMRAGYPIHWYMQFIKYGADALRELTFDTLQVVNTATIQIGAGGVGILPCDYVDYVKVGRKVGQYLRPLVESKTISALHNYDSAGNIARYGDIGTNDINDNVGIAGLDWTMTNNKNENIGRLYGLGIFPGANGFRIFRERGEGEIQLDDQSTAVTIEMDYISDGQALNSASKVHPYAQDYIEAEQIAQLKENGRHYSLQEKAMYRARADQKHRNLRGRINPLTIADYKNIIRGSYTATNHV